MPTSAAYLTLAGGIAFLLVLNAIIVLAAELHWQDGVCVLQTINATSYSLPASEGGGYSGCRAGSANRFLPDQGAWWYYWRLPEPTFGSRSFVWACYVGHQGAAWAAQYNAQKSMQAVPAEERYSSSLRRFNVQLLVIHGGFHLLHLLQTHTTYDGLHGDVSFQSSQVSVIALLGIVFAMEAPSRGMFFGIPSHRGLAKAGVYVVRKYHGYVFQYAAIWTFWCHPMEPLWGFLMGFSHTGLLMLQSALLYTTAHKNRYWRFVLEAWVCAHASVIAMQTLPGWQMFFFGFLALLCVMQLPGLPVFRQVPGAAGLAIRLLPTVGFVAGLAGWYASSDGSVRIMGIVGIPLAEWMVAYFVPWVLWCCLHPRILCARGGGVGESSGAAPTAAATGGWRVFAWAVFWASTFAAVVGGILDWHLPYAAWKRAPDVQPTTYVFSYIGMSVAVLGQLWAAARLLGGPPMETFGGGCCGANVCCAKLGEADAEAAIAADAGTRTAAGYKVEVEVGDAAPPQHA